MNARGIYTLVAAGMLAGLAPVVAIASPGSGTAAARGSVVSTATDSATAVPTDTSSTNVTAPATVTPTPSPTSTKHKEALPHWTYHTDVDGDKTADKVAVRALHGFNLISGYGGRTAKGKYKVAVSLSRSGKKVSKVLSTTEPGFYAPNPFTPYFGSTRLDDHRGRELVFGDFSLGPQFPQVEVFHVLTYRGGALRLLQPPHKANLLWQLYFTQTNKETFSGGWRCIKHGIQRRYVEKTKKGNWQTVKMSFRGRSDGHWHMTHHSSHVTKGLPAETVTFNQFYDCKGLKNYSSGAATK